MFTGLIQHTGVITANQPGPTGARLVVDPLSWSHTPVVGASIAVNGCCLTVVEVHADALHFDVVHQTLDTTTLGALDVGRRVHLEHAVTASTLLGGHIVQGHIDCRACVLRNSEDDPKNKGWRLAVEIPEKLMKFVVEKGSICLDGVSLTIALCTDERVEIALIPETLATTTLEQRKPGDFLNVEIDCLARMIQRQIEAHLAAISSDSDPSES